jgi:hypothetical protein
MQITQLAYRRTAGRQPSAAASAVRTSPRLSEIAVTLAGGVPFSRWNMARAFGTAGQRQRAGATSGRRKERIGQRRRDRWQPGLSEPAPGGIAFHEMHLDRRRLRQREQRIVKEVLLHDGTALDRDLLGNGGAQAHDDRAFDLLRRCVGMNEIAAVDGRHDATDLGPAACVQARLHHMGTDRPEACDQREAATPAGRQGVAPAGASRRGLQHAARAPAFRQESASIHERIQCGPMRQLVD